MPYNFYKLQHEDITFDIINAKNVIDGSMRVRTLHASLTNTKRGLQTYKENAERITYFMGDATDIPLPDHSQSCVVSVFFTNVLPLDYFLAEVIWVLKTGGLFLHFGPLVYHFEDEKQMLTPEHIITVFKENHFSILHHDFLKNQPPESGSTYTMLETYYTNWVFCAPPPVYADTGLNFNDVVSLNGVIDYELKGTLAPGHDGREVHLRLKDNKILKVSELILDLLRRLNGQMNIKEAIIHLSEQYEVPEPYHNHILSTLQQMLDKNIVKVLQH